MIDNLIASYHQYYAQILTWYHAADLLTQYAIIVASGIAVFLLSMMMVLSRITK